MTDGKKVQKVPVRAVDVYMPDGSLFGTIEAMSIRRDAGETLLSSGGKIVAVIPRGWVVIPPDFPF